MASFATSHVKLYDALANAVAANPATGKSVLITGAGRGLGEHIVHAFATAGAARVALVGRDPQNLNKVKKNAQEAFPGTVFEAFPADITDEAKITSVFEQFGAPDIIVNNAGHFPDEGPFIKEDLKSWWKGFEINVLGAATVVQQFLRAKPEGKSAVIISLSSVAIHMRFPFSGWSGYATSKMGQARLSELLRFEHPEVRFINVHPGSVETEGYSRTGLPAPPQGMTDAKLVGQFLTWLTSDEAEFLSGRYVCADWDLDELKAKKEQILKDDLLLTTIDGFVKGF